jgi:ORF6N domain
VTSKNNESRGTLVAEDSLIRAERIERAILVIRSHKVMLDSDLADLFGVTTKQLDAWGRRNLAPFQEDFMFQLTKEDFGDWRSQNATSKMGLRVIPFTSDQNC